MEKYILVNLFRYEKKDFKGDDKYTFMAELYLSDGKHSGDLMKLFIDEETYEYLSVMVPFYSDITDLIKIRYNTYSKKYQAVIYIEN